MTVTRWGLRWQVRRNLAGVGSPDAAALAASCAFGLIRDPLFVDRSKRVGYDLALVLLLDNGLVFTGSTVESVQTIPSLAAGELAEDDVAAWFRGRFRTTD